MNRFLVILALCLLTVNTVVSTACAQKPERPNERSQNFCGQESETYAKYALYWMNPMMNQAKAEDFLLYDLIIVDMDVIFKKASYSKLQEIKRLKPAIKIICYSNPMELWKEDIVFLTDSTDQLREKMHNTVHWQATEAEVKANEAYYWGVDIQHLKRPFQAKLFYLTDTKKTAYILKQANGEEAEYWNGMRMMNLSANCPKIDGLKYNQWIAKQLVENVLSDPIWDGYFMDNCTVNIHWTNDNNGQNMAGIDSDANGRKDSIDMLDPAWRQGVEEFLKYIRQAKGDNFILIGNKGSLAFSNLCQQSKSLLKGEMFENFPCDYLGTKYADGWFQCFENAVQMDQYRIFNAKDMDEDYAKFVLASSFVAGAYFSYSYDDENPSVRSIMEKFRNLGRPLSQAMFFNKETGREALELKDATVVIREFERARVKVFPYDKKGEIVLK